LPEPSMVLGFLPEAHPAKNTSKPAVSVQTIIAVRMITPYLFKDIYVPNREIGRYVAATILSSLDILHPSPIPLRSCRRQDCGWTLEPSTEPVRLVVSERPIHTPRWSLTFRHSRSESMRATARAKCQGGLGSGDPSAVWAVEPRRIRVYVFV